MSAWTSAPFKFNEGQEEAIRRAVTWFKGWHDGAHRKQVFFLTGYAGTGKTSVAKRIASLCAPEHRVVFIAPTGKAASRLRQKGCAGAKTMHQFVYNFRGIDSEDEPIFAEKGSLDERPVLIVLDEASMVGDYDFKSLSRHDIAILALGDLGQVPPVRAAHALTEDHVDFELTEIERQKADSNIIRAAAFVRQGKRLPVREYEDVRVRSGDIPMRELLAHIGEDAQILCTYNNSRLKLTNAIRRELGYTSPVPQVGEKVMCWFNQHDHGFMNGEQGIVLRMEDIPMSSANRDEPEEMQYMWLRSLTDGRDRKVKFNPLSFSKDEETRKEALRGIGGFQFGYLATVHKAQGSEWSKVLIKEELFGDYAKLMYTAVTRAQDQLTIYRAD